MPNYTVDGWVLQNVIHGHHSWNYQDSNIKGVEGSPHKIVELITNNKHDDDNMTI